MTAKTRALQSVGLTILLSFTAPAVVIALVLATAAGLSVLPGCEAIGTLSLAQVKAFLAVFGSGCPLAGVLTIALTGAFAGGLFGVFNATWRDRLGIGTTSLGSES